MLVPRRARDLSAEEVFARLSCRRQSSPIEASDRTRSRGARSCSRARRSWPVIDETLHDWRGHEIRRELVRFELVQQHFVVLDWKSAEGPAGPGMPAIPLSTGKPSGRRRACERNGWPSDDLPGRPVCAVMMSCTRAISVGRGFRASGRTVPPTSRSAKPNSRPPAGANREAHAA